jgi:parallel beta-helix repeat protein
MEPRSQKSAAPWAVLAGALALGGALLPGSAGPAMAAPMPIATCGALITRPGRYVLIADLTCDVTAITVAADGVRLDLGGRTLTGDGEGFVFGVLAEGTPGNPTVEGLRVGNGTVRGFLDGVRIENAIGARVAGVTASGNDDDGLDVRDSRGVRLVRNVAAGNGDDGFDLLVCQSCVVAGNRAAENGGDGIETDDLARTRVVDNRASGNGDDGIGLDGAGAERNLVRGNTATDNGSSGIQVGAGPTGNRLAGNRATGNGGFDLFDGNLPACVNAWRGNDFLTDNENDGPGGGCIQ